MWADTLLAAERLHLLRLLVWGGASVVVGLALFLTVRRGSPLLRHFGMQMLAWGLIVLAIAGWGWRGLALRDFNGAMALERILWLNIGLDLGYVGVGATLALCGWYLGRRLGPVGAGTAVMVQGLALMLLDLQLVSVIVH